MPFDPNTNLVSSVGKDLYDNLRPIADPYDADRGYALAVYAEALGRMFQPAEDVVRDSEFLLDPDVTLDTWLPWLSQFNGSGVPEGGSGDSAADREQIKNPPQGGRGTVPYILGKIQARLTGTKTVYYTERGINGSAYRGAIQTLVSETPDTEHLIATNLAVSPKTANGFTGQSLTAGPTTVAVPGAIPPSNMYRQEDTVSVNNFVSFSVDAVGDGMYLTFPVVNGRQYRASAWLYGTAGQISMEVKTSADVQKFTTSNFTPASAIVEASLDFTADATDNAWRLKFTNQTAAVGTFQVSAVLIEDKSLFPVGSSYIGRYFDGDAVDLHNLTGADRKFWNGTANNSTSTWEAVTKLRELLNGIPGTTYYGIKPAAVIIDYSTTLGGDWNTLLLQHASWTEVSTDFADWQAVLNNPAQT